jgi:hypothetical protein
VTPVTLTIVVSPSNLQRCAGEVAPSAPRQALWGSEVLAVDDGTSASTVFRTTAMTRRGPHFHYGLRGPDQERKAGRIHVRARGATSYAPQLSAGVGPGLSKHESKDTFQRVLSCAE